MTVGIIGFGRIGKLIARYFAKEWDIVACDRRLDRKEAGRLGARPGTIEEAAACDLVLPCVPIGEFEAVVRTIRGLVRPGALVVDVCSVKEHPARVMKRLLPRAVDIVATHPNFGPDSAAETLRGRQMAVCPVRVRGPLWRKVERALEAKGVELVRLTPREHDRRMASSLVLTHFVGRALIDFKAKPTGIDTEGYKRLIIPFARLSL